MGKKITDDSSRKNVEKEIISNFDDLDLSDLQAILKRVSYIGRPLLFGDKNDFRRKFEFYFANPSGSAKVIVTDKFMILQKELSKVKKNNKKFLVIHFIDVRSIDTHSASDFGLLFRFTDIAELHSGNMFKIDNDDIYFLKQDGMLELLQNLDMQKVMEEFRRGLGIEIAKRTGNPFISEWLEFKNSEFTQHAYKTDMHIELICLFERKGVPTDTVFQRDDRRLSLAFLVDQSKPEDFWDLGNLKP